MVPPEKWNPSRDLERFGHEVDDLLEKFGLEHGPLRQDWEPFTTLRPAVESYVEGDKFVVRMELPGINPQEIDINVTGGVLTVKGSREQKTETKKSSFYRREIRYGLFERSISLPEGIKADDLKATYRDGILELNAAMPREAAPKQVKVQIERHDEKKNNGTKKTA